MNIFYQINLAVYISKQVFWYRIVAVMVNKLLLLVDINVIFN